MKQRKTYARYALPRFSERMGLVVRMRVGDGKSPPAPTPGVDAGGVTTPRKTAPTPASPMKS